MVGHTGVYEAAVKAVEATDKAIGIVYEACKRNGYILFVTADHGNAEKMISDEGGPFTAHTTARGESRGSGSTSEQLFTQRLHQVPFVMASNKYKFIPDKIGALCDVAPTILDVMGLPIPEDMDGHSLIQH